MFVSYKTGHTNEKQNEREMKFDLSIVSIVTDFTETKLPYFYDSNFCVCH